MLYIYIAVEFGIAEWECCVAEYTYGKNTLPEKVSLVDEKALDQLVEMGFSRRKATKALLVNR